MELNQVAKTQQDLVDLLGAVSRARQGNATSNQADDEDVRSRTQDLIMVSAYRPCGSSKGSMSVWAQHKDYFLAKGRQEDPRSAFNTDLENAIEEWTSWGCEIIIGMDTNEDLTNTGSTSIRSRLKALGLTEAILHRFPDSPPATQIDNTRNEPIDGIFTTSGVKVQADGYYGFYEQGDSDHRALWVDIDLFTTLGGFTPTKNYSTRRLNVKNRLVRRRYVRLAEEGYKRCNIPHRLDKLNFQLARQGGSITPSQEARYNAIHSDIRRIRSQAEIKCRKIKRGGTKLFKIVSTFGESYSTVMRENGSLHVSSVGFWSRQVFEMHTNGTPSPLKLNFRKIYVSIAGYLDPIPSPPGGKPFL